MNVAYFIARKVAAGGQKSFSRIILMIAIIAVALSVTVMITATSLVSGFKKEISQKIYGFWGHIHITHFDSNNSFEAFPVSTNQTYYPNLDSIRNVKYIKQRSIIGIPFKHKARTRGGIRHIQKFANKPGIIKTNDQLEGIILKGVGDDFDWSFLKEFILEGEAMNLADSTTSEDILVSEQTSKRLSLGLGDRFQVHFVEGEVQQVRIFTIKGIYKTGVEEYDRKFALVDIRQIQHLNKWSPDQVSGFEIFIDDIRDLDVFGDYVYEEEIGYDQYAKTIREFDPVIFNWLDLQDMNIFIIMVMMFIVAILNMSTALLILILERTNMIGILKAMGETNWSIRKIFLYYAGFVLGIGLFLGNFLGILICFIQKKFGVVRLDEASYYVSVAPVDINLSSILLINLLTLLITLIALIIPTYLVTRITPLKAIRFR